MKAQNIITTTLLLFFSTICSCHLFQPIDQTKKDEIFKNGNTQFDYWMHSPLHPDNNRPVIFKTKIKEPLGITTIELHIYEYELYLNRDKLPSKRKRANGQWGKVKTWEGNGNKELSLSHTFTSGFPKESQIEYIFKVIDSKGQLSERLAIFDAGTSPWPNDKILLYSASRAELSQTFNLCFFPDVDFKSNWKSFLDDSHKMIFDGFHQSNVMNDRKERWTFYYTQQEANGLMIAQEFDNPDHYPDFMKEELITGIDAFALLHKKPYSDGSYMYGNIHFLSQNVFTTESYNPGTAIHEMGHSVFQLSDEYNGCACFQPTEGFSNVFTTERACLDFQSDRSLKTQECHEIVSINGTRWYTPEKHVYFTTEQACFDYNKENGFTEKNCIQFIQANGATFFRSEEGICIMNDDGDAKIYPFQETCMEVVDDHYSRFGGKIIASREEPNVLSENMYGYEPVVYLTMLNENGVWSTEVEKIDFGIPVKRNRKGNDATLTFLYDDNKPAYTLNINRPGEGHFCGSNAKEMIKHSEVTKCMIAVPYSAGLQEVVVENKTAVKPQQSIKGSTKQRINLQKQLKRVADKKAK